MLQAGRRAARELRKVAEGFEQDGYRVEPETGAARLERSGALALRLGMARRGRIFGGTYALELTTAEPVLPASMGLNGRPRGIVRLGGVDFRCRDGDEEGRLLAARLEGDERLQTALSAVHFDRVRVEPDGRPVIRHMGGSVVWVLVPPVVRAVPLVPEQRRAAIVALEAFAAAV